jgi:CcmD family protein
VLGLDQNGGYVLAALAITIVVLGGYGLYLRSRLNGLQRRAAGGEAAADSDQSARKVSAAAPIPSTAQPASSANGPTTP